MRFPFTTLDGQNTTYLCPSGKPADLQTLTIPVEDRLSAVTRNVDVSMSLTDESLQVDQMLADFMEHEKYLRYVIGEDNQYEPSTRTAGKHSAAILLTSALSSQAAYLVRFHYEHLDADGNAGCLPAKWNCLGSIARLKPFPAANREYDTACALLFKEVGNHRCERGREWALTNFETFVDVLFKATVLRLTGRVLVYQNSFADFAAKNNAATTGCLPCVQDWEVYLSWVQRSATRSAGRVSVSTKLFSHQFQLPQCMKDFPVFSECIRRLAGDISISSRHMLGSSEAFNEDEQRVKALLFLQTLLVNCIGEYSKGKNMLEDKRYLKFVASEILKDMDCLFEEPFGIPTANSVEMGFGSKMGLTLFQTDKPMKNVHDILEEYTEQEMRDALLSLDPILLSSFGLGIDLHEETRKKLYNLINGRPFSVITSEHMLCNDYARNIATDASRLVSSKANPSNTFTMPIPGMEWSEEFVNDVRERKAALELSLELGLFPQVHPIFLLLKGDVANPIHGDNQGDNPS